MSRRILIIVSIGAGALVGGVLLFALWPRGMCDLSPCTLHPRSVCITVHIVGPCPVTASTIAVPVVVGFVALAVVLVFGLWRGREREP